MLSPILIRMLGILLLAIGGGQAGKKPNTFWSKRSGEGRLKNNQEVSTHLIGDKPISYLHWTTSERFDELEFNHFPFSTIVRRKERKNRKRHSRLISTLERM